MAVVVVRGKTKSSKRECILWTVVIGFVVLVGFIAITVFLAAQDDVDGLEPVFLDNISAEIRSDTDNLGVLFVGDPSEVERDAFISAASRWSDIIADTEYPILFFNDNSEFCDLFNVADSFVIDHLLIFALVGPIDGKSGTLAFAGPCEFINEDSNFPIIGQMVFDTDDNEDLIADGTFESVVLHEMGHVLGIGTLWSFAGQGFVDVVNELDEEERLLQDPLFNFFNGVFDANADPQFIGTNAVEAFGIIKDATVNSVPVEDGRVDGFTIDDFNNEEGLGSVDGHWEFEEFVTVNGNTITQTELMVFAIVPSVPSFPLSTVTIASLADLGYNVDIREADEFTLDSRTIAKNAPLAKNVFENAHFLVNDIKTFSRP